MNRIFIICLLPFLILYQHSFADTFQYQYGIDNYTNFHDLRIQESLPNYCGGNDLRVRDIGLVTGLVQFASMTVPQGNYHFQVQFTSKDIITPGTVVAEILKKTSWSDPHVYLNPPATDSIHPTWSHENYSTLLWESPGATGSSDRGPVIGESYISQATQTCTFSGTVLIKKGQTALGFRLSTPNGYINLYCSDTCGTNYFLTPKLILQGPIWLGGLDKSAMTKPFQPLR